MGEVTTSPPISVTMTVNGQTVQAAVPGHRLLVDFIRETLGLTGTKVGCETGQCGACLILVDGVSVKSCAMLAAQADGRTITTVEGLASKGNLGPLQTAFWEAHASQCGFCTPGMLISMTDLIQRNPQPSEQEIRTWMDGTMCRCGVYQNAVKAVVQVTQTQPVAAGANGGE